MEVSKKALAEYPTVAIIYLDYSKEELLFLIHMNCT